MSAELKWNKNFTPIGAVLQKTLADYRQKLTGDLDNVFDLWPQAVGEAIAGNTQPAGIKNRLLVVNVNSSVWIHELRFLKADIIKKINAALGKTALEDIRLRIGPLS